MKKIKEWLEELPQPYREQALENYDPEFNWDKEELVDSLRWSLVMAFDWSKSSQGSEYWNEI